MNHLKSNWYISIALVVSVVSIIVFNVNNDFMFKDLTMSWTATHYAINYIDFGFVKRGLIGSFYKIINGSFSQESLFLFQFSFIILLVFVTHFLFLKFNLNNRFVYIVFILSPATFMQFGSDFGRFDPILVSIFMLSIIYRSNSFVFIIFSILGILTHEIYIFALLPAAFILYLLERNSLVSFKDIVIGVIKSRDFYILIASIILIISMGYYELGYEKILDTFSQSKLPPSYIEFYKGWSNVHIWTSSISDNLSFASQRLSLTVDTVYMIFIYLIMLVYLHVIGVDFKKPKYYIILVSSFPMFFLGTDWARWLAFIYVSIFLIFITTEGCKAKNISNKSILIFSLYGPLGVGGYLPPLLDKIF
ncbi:hypothetical protein [Vibrio coralliilyticus]|uniref:hypothetical protein n=1 Tax=Vibrio coralliilyticus TaxID=190893 RepID=UPI0006CDE7F4|nr:hypothetical protein [Vibrio coralliilyticus]AXN31881.1 hypothetical protein DVV14_11600 [Vibrio coralliilyticus]KPH26586.1 hypothetical protein ADU60_15545 [Vibrio coralliilyticus]